MPKKSLGLFQKSIDTIASRLGYVNLGRVDKARGGRDGSYQAISYMPTNSGVLAANPDAYKTPETGIRKPTNISFSTLRQVSKYDAIIRICINAIKKSVSQSRWDVNLKEGEKMTPAAKEAITYVKNLFSLQNRNNENMRILLDRVIEDLLILDAGVIEKVRNIKGNIVGLNSVDGATIRPRYNTYGEFDPEAAYVQVINEKVVAKFQQEDLIYMMANPQNDIALFGYGMSPIESILLTVQASLNADMHNARAFSDDNVPPGMLNLGEMTNEQAQEFIAIWDATVINDMRRIKFTWGNKGEMKYTPFQTNNKDMQFVEYIDWLSRLKLATYGLTSIDANITQDVNRSTANAQRGISQSRGVQSVKRLFEEYFNREIILDMAKTNEAMSILEFKFEEAEDLESKKSQADIDKIYIEAAVQTPEEIRIREGFATDDEQLDGTEEVTSTEEATPNNPKTAEDTIEESNPDAVKSVRKTASTQFVSRYYPPLAD